MHTTINILNLTINTHNTNNNRNDERNKSGGLDEETPTPAMSTSFRFLQHAQTQPGTRSWIMSSRKIW